VGGPKSIPLTQQEALLPKEQLLAWIAGRRSSFRRKEEQWNRHRFRDRVWQPATEAAGYDALGFHQPRHTAISLMCRAGYRPEWVAERVGHSDGGALVLKCYRHLYPSESYAAAPSLDAPVAARPAERGQGADTADAEGLTNDIAVRQKLMMGAPGIEPGTSRVWSLRLRAVARIGINLTPASELAPGQHRRLVRVESRYLIANKDPLVDIREVTTGIRT